MGYLACSAILGLLVIAKHTILSFDSVLLNVHAYNNPLLILAAVFLLLTFASIHIPFSRVINWLSFSALSIYLITDNSYFDQWYYPRVGYYVKTLMPILSWLLMVVVAVVTMICCILLDKVRLLIAIPVDRMTVGIVEKLDDMYLNAWNGKDKKRNETSLS